MKYRAPTIGLQLTNVYDEYSVQLLSGASEAAEKLGCNLLVFLGEALDNPRGYLYQGNIIYDHIHSRNIDALIASAGTLANFATPQRFQQFFDSCHDIPVISLGLNLKGYTSIIVDNTSGMEAVTRHMIQTVGYRTPVFLHGPAGNPEAQERYRSFRKVMEEQDLVFDERLLVYGDFTEQSGAEAMQKLHEKDAVFDCVIASNDNMALGAMQFLQIQGIRIPRDIGISGFDNFPESRFTVPPLTTVKQPFYKQGWAAAEQAYLAINGDSEIRQILLPTELIVRASCGATQAQMDKINTIIAENIHNNGTRYPDFPNEIHALLSLIEQGTDNKKTEEEFLAKLEGLLQSQVSGTAPTQYWEQLLEIIRIKTEPDDQSDFDRKQREVLFLKARILVSEAEQMQQAANRFRLEKRITIGRDMIQRMTSTISITGLAKLLKNDLPRFNVSCAYLIAYENIIKHTQEKKWDQPEHLQLIMGYDLKTPKGRPSVLPDTFESTRILPDEAYPRDRLYRRVISPLYFREEQLGYMVLETSDIHTNVYETLTNQIAASMKTALLFKQQETTEQQLRAALRTLEHYSLKLKMMAERDEMTGLYNRRGFLSLVPQQMDLLKSVKGSAHMLYVDLDGMKLINDSFGHREGDQAIIATANILRSCLRSTDIIARMGGDEFVAFIIEDKPGSIKILTDRIQQATICYNQSSSKPYSLSLSFGSIHFPTDTSDDIELLIHQADEMLYDMKRRKKAKHQNFEGATELLP